MRLCRRTIYVNRFGDSSDGTSMYDWSDDKLINCMNETWSKDLHELAKKILQKRKDKLLKLKLD